MKKYLHVLLWSVIGLLVITVAVVLFALLNSRDACFIIDKNEEIKQVTIDQKTYYLYFGTVGWHDKSHTLALYDKKPDIDSCGSVTQDAFAETGYAWGQGVPVKIYVTQSYFGRTMEVEYDNTASGQVSLNEDLYNADVFIKPATNKEIKQVTLNMKTYYLYLQTSLLETDSYFVLYDQRPSFDSDGKVNPEPIDYRGVYPEPWTPAKIILSDGPRLEIEYIEKADYHPTLLDAVANAEIVVQHDSASTGSDE
jgi:hypothetical protein